MMYSQLSYKPIIKIMMYSPYYKERVSIEVVTLNNVFRVLKHNFNKSSEISAHNRSVQIQTSSGGIWWYAANAKNSSNFEVVSQLQGSVSWDKGNAVDSISLFAMDLTSTTRQPDSSAGFYHAIMVRALWIRPWSASCEITPEMQTICLSTKLSDIFWFFLHVFYQISKSLESKVLYDIIIIFFIECRCCFLYLVSKSQTSVKMRDS